MFPRWAAALRKTGQVYVPFDYATYFAHYLLREQHDLWQVTEQALEITEQYEARFFVRAGGDGHA